MTDPRPARARIAADPGSHPGVTYRRCPTCNAVAWPGWPIVHRHRPPCPHDGIDPDNWSDHE